MYKKYENKYIKFAKNGITTKTYLLALQNFSVYVNLMNDKNISCPIVKKFFVNQPFKTINEFNDLERSFILKYLSSVFILEKTIFKNYFLKKEDFNYIITQKQLLIFSGNLVTDILRDLILNRTEIRFEYYKKFVQILNDHSYILGFNEIYFLLYFSVVYTKSKLYSIISEEKLYSKYLELKINYRYNEMILLSLLLNIDRRNIIDDVELEYDNLYFDCKFILLAYIYEIER